MISLMPQDEEFVGGSAGEDNFGLDALYHFINDMWSDTETTKRTLEKECEEAKFALKPWLIESTLVRKVDPNTCSCEELERPEEIAEQIAKTLLHTQQLREKIAMNLNKERQESRKPSVQEIYGHAVPALKEVNSVNSVNSAKRVQRRNRSQVRDGSGPIVQQRTVGRSVSQQRNNRNGQQLIPKQESISFRRLNGGGGGGGGGENANRPNRSRSLVKNQFRTSRDNSLARLISTERNKSSRTNFILANKLRVRSGGGGGGAKPIDIHKLPPLKFRSERPRKTTNINGKLNDKQPKSSKPLKEVRSDEFATPGELEHLIKKFTSSQMINDFQPKENCPIHGKNAPAFVEEKVITSVDAIEGLDRFNFSGNLIGILRAYHAYVRAEVFQDNTSQAAKKHREAGESYLANLEATNKRREEASTRPYRTLLTEFSGLVRDCHAVNLSKGQLRSMGMRFKGLQPLYEEGGIKRRAGVLTICQKYKEYEQLWPDMKNWMSNGVWNSLCIPKIQGMFGTECTRYSNKKQLLVLYDFVQKIQRDTYELELMELVLASVIPWVREYLESGSQEFAQIYKMIASLAQILNPKVPVLARTEP